jgi:hypothetical protein
MKKLTIFLIVAGVLLIITGLLWIAFCYSISDPEIEGESARTPLSSYLLSLVPITLGVLFLIISNKVEKKISE